ncbi:MAG: hypothetical protein ACYDBH_01045 [Acidobacteriaceae bacterium]
MRYYKIALSGGNLSQPVSWTSHPNGLYSPPDPGALDIELDMLIYPEGTPMGASSVTIHGVPLIDLFQGNMFAGSTMTFDAGMGKGLPLSDPKQAGRIFQGIVFQSFGNWVGTEMSLDLVPIADIHNSANPAKINFVYQANSNFGAAIQRALEASYPTASSVTVTISPNVVFPFDMAHNSDDLGQFAIYLQNITNGMLGPTYPGVSLVYQDGEILVSDWSQQTREIQISFRDLVGQPTLIEANLIQIRTVLRSDIKVGSLISLPSGAASLPGFVQTTYASMPSSIKYKTTFSGQFIVQQVRQIGHYRMPDGNAWISVFNAVPLASAS